MTASLRQFLALSLVPLILGGAGLASADKSGYYRWTDDGGTIQYTQLPPVGRESVFVATKSGRISSSASADNAEEQVDGTEEPTQKQASNSLPARMDVLPQKDAQRCKQGRDMVQATNNKSKRFRVIDDTGETRLLSPEEVEEQRTRAQEMIDLHC